MGYIYKITNVINQKMYIGKTSQTPSIRWSQHVSSALVSPNVKDYNFLLHKAIRKYGKENFTLQIVEEVADTLMSARETYWIDYYKTCILTEEGKTKGYNMTFGGEGSVSINYKEVHDLWDLGYGSRKIAQSMNCHNASVVKILSSKSNFSTKDNILRNRPNNKTVYCFDSDGKLIAEYDSIQLASETIGLDRSMISKCCSKDKRSAGGYFWSFSPNFITPQTPAKTWKQYSITQLSLNGDIIAEHNSLSDAVKAVGKTNTKQIKECCDGIRTSMYGFKWRYNE